MTITRPLEFTGSTGPHLSELGIRALAALVAADIRPDWDTPGIITILRAVRDATTADKLAVAFIRGAHDQRNQTPAFIRYPNNHAWRDDLPCPDHPQSGRRPDGECAGCHVDRLDATPGDATAADER